MCNGANCMHKTALNLRAAVSPDHMVEPADILDTKKALMTLGYYQPLDGAQPGAWVDNDLFAGIKEFQRDNGLKVDALVRPGGPTEKALNDALGDAPPNVPANDDQRPSNDNETNIALGDCYHRYDVVDGNVCRSLPTVARRGRCWESAGARLGACQANLRSPQLVTW